MLKIIKNLESRLIEEAKVQIEAAGYGALTIRSVAKGCGVGVGTLYTHSPSKDALVASWLLQDWKECISQIRITAANSEQTLPVIRCIYEQLRQISLSTSWLSL